MAAKSRGASPDKRRKYDEAFKAELLDGGSSPGLAEARLEISHHIADYNAERRHSALGYQGPNHFEIHLQTTSQLYSA